MALESDLGHVFELDFVLSHVSLSLKHFKVLHYF